MSPLVKTKRQANFKDFKRFGAFQGLVEQKKPCIQLVRVSIGLFWHSWAHSCQKTPIYTRTPQINYSRNVMDVDWGLVVKLALPAKVTRRANKVIGIYDRSH
jgi:hypothetical protein